MNFLNFIPPIVRERVVQFLVSKAGAALVPFIAAGVALGVTKFAEVFPAVAPLINQQAVVVFIWGVLMTGVNYATNHWLTKDAKVIQEALVKVGAELDVDGWVGDKTVKAFEMETGIPVRKALVVNPPPTPPADL